MTSILHQRCTTILACVSIAVLLAFIIVVWVQYENGAFKNNMDRANVEFTSANATRAWKTHQNTEKTKEILERTHLDSIEGLVEFVKPLKVIPNSLHPHDRIYEQMKNNEEKPTPPLMRHHSGHFRHKMAEVWDPHPQYEIRAFGQTLHLELANENNFVSPDLQILQVSDNFTQRVRHDPRISGCFYRGTVRGDSDSSVTVSLCNGMTGYIRTSEGNYYIEPMQAFHDVRSSILHRIKKIPHLDREGKSKAASNDAVYDEQRHEKVDQCDANERSNIITDEFPEVQHDRKRRRTKRSSFVYEDQEADAYYYDDEDEEEMNDDVVNESRRSARDTEWIRKTYSYGSRENDPENNQFNIEILVVADKKMTEYHGDYDDLKHYILTLMSHVSLLYRDATIGNAITLTVVNISILKEEFDGSNSGKMLQDFCKWQRNYSKSHDVALLLTRKHICRNSGMPCNTVGVAEVGSMCNPNSSCAIVHDKGLSTSYTIAHEIGHTLNMPHDDDRRCERFNINMNTKNIMGRMLQNDTKPWIWSPCSKFYVTEFLDSNKAGCLLNSPQENVVVSEIAKTLPGESFTADEQCELEYGPGWVICPFMPECAMLWCTNTYNTSKGCTTGKLPWADGTICDANKEKWCHTGMCIPIDRKLIRPIDGGWGDWQEWGPCTRTCGGGISQSRRNCDSPPPSHGGTYCPGRSIRYRSCNTQSCDENMPDFREVQCAEFNGDTKGIHDLTSSVTWVPKYGLSSPEDLCKLYCRVNNTNSHYLLKEKVVDGTKCGLNSHDICVNGICRRGGCDNELESNLTLDDCGNCGGDNSQCEKIVGTYNKSLYGYNRVVRIPKGSYNLIVEQRGYRNSFNDSNYLALVDGETGSYILNGNYVVSIYQKEVPHGVLFVNYNGAENVIERLNTSKHSKLSKDLVIEVLSVGSLYPPDITYNYTVNKNNAPRFGWRLYEKPWSVCNSLCQGTQRRDPDCFELATNKLVAEGNCSGLDSSGSFQVQECNMDCQLQWNIRYTPCSAHCGTGIRNVIYKCVKISKSLQELVDNQHCAILPKPPEWETCQGPCDSTRWEYSEWSECSKSCGGGSQYRSAECVSNDSEKIHESMCDPNEKVVEQICNNQKCPVWSLGDWTPCSVTCGKGYRTKPYYCHVGGLISNKEFCDPNKLPIVHEECEERPCTQWHTGRWNECNVSCGTGSQRRLVSCQTLDHRTVDEHHCRWMLKPNSTRECHKEKCNNLQMVAEFDDNSILNPVAAFSWVTGEWGKCSKSCGNGTKLRMVACQKHFGTIFPDEYCYQKHRPHNSESCNVHPCARWITGSWGKCDENCYKHRQIRCQNSTGQVINERECESGKKPQHSQKCTIVECPYPKNYYSKHHKNSTMKDISINWVPEKWGPCSSSCGKGSRKRQVLCKDTLNKISLVDAACKYLKKPVETQTCEKYNCPYTWIEGDWSQCSASCGHGVKTRNVTCHKVYNGCFIDPNPHHSKFCTNRKPTTTSNCVARCTDQYHWISGPWRKCSSACGRKGRQIRQIFCVNRYGRKVARRLCPKNSKPQKKRKCNQHCCLPHSCKEASHKSKHDKDYIIQLAAKPVTIYCHKMTTNQPVEYISLRRDHNNYAEHYNKRLNDLNSCPYGGERREKCDCNEIEPDRYGLTRFTKVRLNITTMKIVPDDFTFSRTLHGRQIPFGTAGDCYSQQIGCPQGRFSIDLTGTSFKLKRGVRWRSNGHFASDQVNIQGQVANGKCGGYCGTCEPHPDLGLAVEVT